MTMLCVCCSEDVLKKAGHVARDELLAFGTCFGKFTKTSKFRLHITALDFLAPYAKVVTTCLLIASHGYCAVV